MVTAVHSWMPGAPGPCAPGCRLAPGEPGKRACRVEVWAREHLPSVPSGLLSSDFGSSGVGLPLESLPLTPNLSSAESDGHALTAEESRAAEDWPGLVALG